MSNQAHFEEIKISGNVREGSVIYGPVFDKEAFMEFLCTVSRPLPDEEDVAWAEAARKAKASGMQTPEETAESRRRRADA